MPDLELLVAFIAATALFAYMPGPSMLYTAAQTLARGRRGGFMAALGIHVGGYVHVLAAALGLALLFQAVPVMYTVMKLAGAAYLVWLGVSLMITRNDGATLVSDPQTAARPAFWQSALVEVLNPKTAIFYLAFLPQFTDPAAALPLWAQLTILGTVVNLMFSSADLLCVLLADRLLLAFQRSPASARLANRFGGAALIALGVNLAASR